MPKKQVAVAMSGGVDSSLAAALLKEAGYEVSGVHLKLWANPDRKNNLSVLEQTCQLLDIPLRKLNFEGVFRRLVIGYFHREYNRGRTPNPCIMCNHHIKFGRLLTRVLKTGADYLATGHYARIKNSPNGYGLLKGDDPTKDQSYFLYTLGQRELKYLLFPLGNLKKTEVRRLATQRGLPTNNRPESQDICFIPDNDYRAFIARHTPATPGDIIDSSGHTVGRHSGLAYYTIGQRQGLGLSLNDPRYVLKFDVAGNRIVVGTKDQLLKSSLSAGKLTWVRGTPPSELNNIKTKIRYGALEAPAKLDINDGNAKIQFHEPQSAITPGQAIVFYQDEEVLGGGIIEDR
jgi:tRNA-specific 2-thiouridylase